MMIPGAWGSSAGLLVIYFNRILTQFDTTSVILNVSFVYLWHNIYIIRVGGISKSVEKLTCSGYVNIAFSPTRDASPPLEVAFSD